MTEFTFRSKSEIKISGKFFQFPINTTKLPIKNTLLLIHAFPFSSEMYEPNFTDSFIQEELNDLARKRGSIQIILPDLPGFGQSETFMEQPKNLTPYVDIIKEVLEHFGIKKCIVGGCSMGGYISLEFARRFSNKINGLILIDSKATADTMEAKENRYKTMEMVRKSLVFWGKSSEIDSEDQKIHESLRQYRQFLNELHLKIISNHTKSNLPEISSQIYKIMHQQNPLAVIHALGGIAGRSDTTNILQRLKIPVLILVGENDFLTPIDTAKEMRNILRNGTLKIISQAGHLSNIENITEFNKEITMWIKDNLS